MPYHVDLAIYATNKRGNLYLARGMPGSKPGLQEWVESDPLGFIQCVGEKLEGQERSQFHRVVRYLKRWRDLSFVDTGHDASLAD